MSEPSVSRTLWHQRLADLCSTQGRRMYHLAYDILRDAHAAEDVCQQAFAKACQQRFAVDSPDRLRPWLAKVVVNESLQLLRRSKIEQRFRQQYVRLGYIGAARDENPHLREAVMSALATLPEPNGVVVLLRVMQGMTGNEVKDILGCSASEVSRRLHAGMEQLRVMLADFNVHSAREFSHGS